MHTSDDHHPSYSASVARVKRGSPGQSALEKPHAIRRLSAGSVTIMCRYVLEALRPISRDGRRPARGPEPSISTSHACTAERPFATPPWLAIVRHGRATSRTPSAEQRRCPVWLESP